MPRPPFAEEPSDAGQPGTAAGTEVGSAGRLSQPQMPKLSFFSGAELRLVGNLEEFLRTAEETELPDLRFVHGREGAGGAPAKGLMRGITWFGPGKSCSHQAFADATARMTEVESISLRNAAYAPMYATVFSADRGVYLPSAAEFSLPGRGADALVKADPSYAFDATGSLTLNSFSALEHYDGIGVPGVRDRIPKLWAFPV